jgi:hypothetical protein
MDWLKNSPGPPLPAAPGCRGTISSGKPASTSSVGGVEVSCSTFSEGRPATMNPKWLPYRSPVDVENLPVGPQAQLNLDLGARRDQN